MRKVEIELTVKMTLTINEGIELQQVVNELDYEFYDTTGKGIKTTEKICNIYPQLGYIFIPKQHGKDLYEFTYNKGKKFVQNWLDENNLLI